MHVKFSKLRSGSASFGARVGLLLIGETDLAPLSRPLILVETCERIHDALGIITANVLERAEPSSAPQHLRLDLIERSFA